MLVGWWEGDRCRESGDVMRFLYSRQIMSKSIPNNLNSSLNRDDVFTPFSTVLFQIR